MKRDTELPFVIVIGCMVMAIVLCTPLLIISAVRTRRSSALSTEYVLLVPARRDGL